VIGARILRFAGIDSVLPSSAQTKPEGVLPMKTAVLAAAFASFAGAAFAYGGCGSFETTAQTPKIVTEAPAPAPVGS
jgi:hypothetical protein